MIAESLDHLVPGAKYRGSLTADTQEAYDALVWEDERKKPGFDEIQAAASTAMDNLVNKTAAREVDGLKALKAVVQWVAPLVGKTPAQARQEIIALLKSLD